MTMTIAARPAGTVQPPRGPYLVIMKGEPGYTSLEKLAIEIGRLAGFNKTDEDVHHYGAYSSEFTARELLDLGAQHPAVSAAIEGLSKQHAELIFGSHHVMKIISSDAFESGANVTLSSEALDGEPTGTWANAIVADVLDSYGFVSGEYFSAYNIAAADLAKITPFCDRGHRLVQIARYGIETYGPDARVNIA